MPAKPPNTCAKTRPSSRIQPTGPRSKKNTRWNCAPVTANANSSRRFLRPLARIESGEYGFCDETGEPIGLGRLIARPTATLSLEAQQRRELEAKDVRRLSTKAFGDCTPRHTRIMSPKETGFFRKVVRFVANPTTEWSDLELKSPGVVESEYAKARRIKAMIERKRRNDFVRKREFDMLRKIRREGLSRGCMLRPWRAPRTLTILEVTHHTNGAPSGRRGQGKNRRH
jgi:hypothetical protein